jgi:hypothetical protein
MGDTADDLNDREKAAALEDFVTAFGDEWVDLDQSDTWIVVDGSAEVSPETVRVLRLMFATAKSER